MSQQLKEVFDRAQTAIQTAEESNFKSSIEAFGDLYGASIALQGAIWSVWEAQAGQCLEDLTADKDHVLSLLTSLLGNLPLCDQTILKARYAQSAVLLRQQMEYLEGIREHLHDERKKGVYQLKRYKSFGNIYGLWTELAHGTKATTLENFTRIISGTERLASPIPSYTEYWCKSFLGIHVLFSMGILLDLCDFVDHPLGAPSKDPISEAVARSHGLLLHHEIIEQPTGPLLTT